MKNNLTEKHKKLKKLIKSQIPLSNDVFMIFAINKNFCEEFLRVILQDKKLKVIENDVQKYLPSAFNKTMIIDMLCKLGDGSIVNVEIQLKKEKEHARRIFTYASKIKSYLTEKGEKYKNLKDIIEIYLTKDDIFKKGSTVYEVDMSIISDQKEKISKWDAGLKVYYVNAEGLTNKNIREYLKLLTDSTTVSKKYKTVSKIKKELYKDGGATMSKEMREILDSERAEGKAEGRAEGKLQGMLTMLKSMVKKGILTVKMAADELGVTEKEFLKMAKTIS